MGWCWNGLGRGGWGGLGTLGPILNLALFISALALLGLGVAWLARQVRRTSTSEVMSDPLEIAQGRLAAGEITVAEFEDIRDRLHR